jgi:hypothetical protein
VRQILTACLIAAWCAAYLYGKDSTDLTNDFYDNENLFELSIEAVTVDGEIANSGTVDFSSLPVRSVIVKEAVLKSGRDSFTGAYRYDGYSLYDILNERILKKKNEQEFPRCIDMYVVVTGANGHTAVFTWGEIYYPIHRHEIIIATKVLRIVPSITKELWPIPESAKIVAAGDLITARNISRPVRITVHSFPGSFTVDRKLKPLFSPHVEIVTGDSTVRRLTSLPDKISRNTYATVFYGRGKGIHGVTKFYGGHLKDIISGIFPVSEENIRNGIFCTVAADGYRCVFSYSEICNRNDQAETLIIEQKKEKEGGAFKLFPGADFFSDRAIKALRQMYFLKTDK